MQKPELFKNNFFIVALAIGVAFALPAIYFKIKRKSLMTEALVRFFPKETSAITPDIAGYSLPAYGKMSANDFVHFQLEYLNAVVHAVKKYRKQSAHIVFLRFNTNLETIQKFINISENKKQVLSYLENNAKWKNKTKLAFKALNVQEIKIDFTDYLKKYFHNNKTTNES